MIKERAERGKKSAVYFNGEEIEKEKLAKERRNFFLTIEERYGEGLFHIMME